MPLRVPRVRLTRRRVITGAVVLAVVVGLVAVVAWPASRPYSETDQMITVRSGPGGDEPITPRHDAVPPDGGQRQPHRAGDPAGARLRRHQAQRGR